jgi:hypothetical protein
MAISSSEAKKIKKIISSPSSSKPVSSSASKYAGKSIKTLADGSRVRVKDNEDVDTQINNNLDLPDAPQPLPMDPLPGPTSVASPLTVKGYKDNQDGTTTNALSDGSFSDVKYNKNKDGSLSPYEVDSSVPYDTAVANLNQGGLKGNDLLQAQQNLASKYKQGFQAANNSGIPAPMDGGEARSQMQSFLPQSPTQQDFSGVESMLQADPGWQQLQQMREEYFNPDNQKASLMESYKKLYKSSGLDELDEEIIDAKTIIEGTEDDIRNEIQAAGGFGTDSQVQALSLARNKSLLKNYNNLVAIRESKQNHLDTMLSLAEKDRAYADSQFDRALNFDMKVMEYKDKFVNNTRDALNSIVSKVGYKGLYSAYASDPRQLAFAEKILGVGTGGLSRLATLPPSESDQLDLDIKRLQKQKLMSGSERNTQVVDLGGRNMLIDSDTGETIREIGGAPGAGNELQNAYAEQSISTIDTLKNHKGLSKSVGVGGFARWTPFKVDVRTGEKSDFVAGVEQLTSQLTLDSLINAKARGATFGALSEGEMRVLSGAASKISSWASKNKTGEVTHYNASEKSFKRELDTISNFAKLDYILKGGDPSAVGVRVEPDGKMTTINSDGSVSELN